MSSQSVFAFERIWSDYSDNTFHQGRESSHHMPRKHRMCRVGMRQHLLESWQFSIYHFICMETLWKFETSPLSYLIFSFPSILPFIHSLPIFTFITKQISGVFSFLIELEFFHAQAVLKTHIPLLIGSDYFCDFFSFNTFYRPSGFFLAVGAEKMDRGKKIPAISFVEGNGQEHYGFLLRKSSENNLISLRYCFFFLLSTTKYLLWIFFNSGAFLGMLLLKFLQLLSKKPALIKYFTTLKTTLNIVFLFTHNPQTTFFSVQLWSSSNHIWCLKLVVPLYNTSSAKAIWDTEDRNILYLFSIAEGKKCNTVLEVLKVEQSYTVSEDTLATVAVIDGSVLFFKTTATTKYIKQTKQTNFTLFFSEEVRLTPVSKCIVPPPMSASKITFSENVFFFTMLKFNFNSFSLFR